MARLEFGPHLTKREEAEIDADLKTLREKFDARIAANVRTEKKGRKPIFNVTDLPEDRVQIRDKVMAAYNKIEDERAVERGRKGVRNRLIGPHAEPRKLQDGDPTKMVTTRHVLRHDLPPIKTNRVEQPSIISDEYVNDAIDAAHDAVNKRNGLPNTDLRLYLHDNFPKAVAAASFRETNNVVLGSWKRRARENLQSAIAREWETETHARDVSATGAPQTQGEMVQRAATPMNGGDLVKSSPLIEIAPEELNNTQKSQFPSGEKDDMPGVLRDDVAGGWGERWYKRFTTWARNGK